MTALALALLLAQQPAAVGERSMVSKCPVSDDATYGYTKENPIRVGGTPVYGASRQRIYLTALAGPAGQPLTFTRRGALPPNPDGIIVDHYEATYPGAEKPIDLYLDFYRWDPPKAPLGLLCGAELTLGPPREPDTYLSQLFDLAPIAGAKGDVPPIPLGADGSTRHGVVIDTFRFMANLSRMFAAAGTPATRAQLSGLRPGQFVVVTYPLDCTGQIRRPQSIEVIDGAKRQVNRGAFMSDAGARTLLPFAAIPDGALAAVFAGATLPTAGEVRVTYDGPACPDDSHAVALPVKMGPPVKVVNVAPAWPMAVTRSHAGPPVMVQLRITIDLQGVPTNVQVLSPPSEFNIAAVNAVRQWRFKPFTINGAPAYVPLTIPVTVTFSTGTP